MIHVVNTANYRFYFNMSGSDRMVTVALSVAARLEIKAPNGAVVSNFTSGTLGNVVSLRIPPDHFIEVDAAATGVQVELHVQ